MPFFLRFFPSLFGTSSPLERMERLTWGEYQSLRSHILSALESDGT